MKGKLLKTRAYGLFFEELERQLAFVRRKIMDKEVVSEQVFREARGIFHNIKGSAGFFGFETLRQTSSELEKHFSRGLEEAVCEMQGIRELIRGLEAEAKLLPLPSAEKEGTNA